MKKLMLSAFALVAVVLGVNAADDAATKTLQSSAEAVLMKTLTISTTLSDGATTTTLNFGTLAIGADDGSAVVEADGAVASDLLNVVLVDGTQTAATFGVTGNKSATFSIVIPTADLDLGTSLATITDWTCSAGVAGTLDETTGKADFYVGATLDVPNNSVPGIYSENFDVTVAYN